MDAPKGSIKAGGSAAAGPVVSHGSLAAPGRFEECDATAEVRRCGGSGEFDVPEEWDKKRCDDKSPQRLILAVEDPIGRTRQAAHTRAILGCGRDPFSFFHVYLPFASKWLGLENESAILGRPARRQSTTGSVSPSKQATQTSFYVVCSSIDFKAVSSCTIIGPAFCFAWPLFRWGNVRQECLGSICFSLTPISRNEPAWRYGVIALRMCKSINDNQHLTDPPKSFCWSSEPAM